VRSLLGQSLGVFEAQRVAAGWNGDRYQVYERGTNGPTVLVWKSAWETDAAATDFEQAYRRLTEKRALKVRIIRDGQRVTVQQAKDESLLTWLQGGGN
jgi:hypothetical protein